MMGPMPEVTIHPVHGGDCANRIESLARQTHGRVQRNLLTAVMLQLMASTGCIVKPHPQVEEWFKKFYNEES
jgi:hypothetical protein